jgi:hypothetical protein
MSWPFRENFKKYEYESVSETSRFILPWFLFTFFSGTITPNLLVSLLMKKIK